MANTKKNGSLLVREVLLPKALEVYSIWLQEFGYKTKVFGTGRTNKGPCTAGEEIIDYVINKEPSQEDPYGDNFAIIFNYPSRLDSTMTCRDVAYKLMFGLQAKMSYEKLVMVKEEGVVNKPRGKRGRRRKGKLHLVRKPYIPILLVSNDFFKMSEEDQLYRTTGVQNMMNIVGKSKRFKSKEDLLDFMSLHNHSFPRYGHDVDDSGRENQTFNSILSVKELFEIAKTREKINQAPPPPTLRRVGS